MIHKTRILIVSLFLAACSGQPATTSTPGRTSVSLPMGYVANVQFAPFYVAVDRGYFAAEGIDLSFDYKYETDGVKLVVLPNATKCCCAARES